MANSTHPFVSVLTPTYNRRRFMPFAIQFFKAQSYPQDRMEWIIMDDGTDKIGDLFDPKKTGLKNVRYIAVPDGVKLKIGAKRNRMNEVAKGDICVCMDDDDYYPPNRVSDAVFRLRSGLKQKIPMVAASEIYLYFTDRDEIWKAGPYNKNHGTNGTMAYWHSYFKDHKYDENAEKAEERSFTNDWKAPMLQLDGMKTMLVMCHNFNTFDKRRLIENPGPVFQKTGMKLNTFIKDKKVRDFYQSLKAEAIPYNPASAAAAPGLSQVTTVFETPKDSPEVKDSKVDTITLTA
jgi:glycosyltransferase involved in cell wall biosynthesis